MRRLLVFGGAVLVVQLLGAPAQAQPDRLAGRWEGKVQSPQGERPTAAVFKREGDVYTGRMSGLRPGTEIQLKDVKVEDSKLTARAEVGTPQAAAVVNYNMTIEGETMNGRGAVDFGGQEFTFDISLKRVSHETEGALGPAPGPGVEPRRQRNPDVPQPQQKQSIDYFVGQWGYRYLGRESALGPAPRDCTVTFAKRPDGKSVSGVTDCKFDGGAHRETSVIVFDEATKTLTVTEELGGGATLNSRADWGSPISIRFAIDPVKVKGQSLQLRRTITIVAAHSFTVAEELSEDGGPFVRLGNAVVTRVGAQ